MLILQKNCTTHHHVVFLFLAKNMKLSFFKTYHLFLLSLASLQRKHPTIGRTECTNADFDSEIDFSLDAEPGRPDVLLDVGHGSDAAVPAVAGRWPRSVTGRRR